jgi:hypothetical protein
LSQSELAHKTSGRDAQLSVVECQQGNSEESTNTQFNRSVFLPTETDCRPQDAMIETDSFRLDRDEERESKMRVTPMLCDDLGGVTTSPGSSRSASKVGSGAHCITYGKPNISALLSDRHPASRPLGRLALTKPTKIVRATTSSKRTRIGKA